MYESCARLPAPDFYDHGASKKKVAALGSSSQENNWLRLSWRILLAVSPFTPISYRALVCASKTAAFHPRGKKEESVPKRSLPGPATSKARLKTALRSRCASS